MLQRLEPFGSKVLLASDLKEFSRPDFSAPLDVEAHLRGVSKAATVQGGLLYGFQNLGKSEGIEGITQHHFLPFRSYSMEVTLRFIAELAGAMSPQETLREGIRRMGWRAFEMFRDTLLGRSLMQAINHDLAAVLSNIELAYKGQEGHAEMYVAEVGERHVLFSYQQIYTFLDSFEVGVLEGVVKHFGESPEVWLRLDSSHRGDILVRW